MLISGFYTASWELGTAVDHELDVQSPVLLCWHPVRALCVAPRLAAAMSPFTHSESVRGGVGSDT